MKTVETMTDDDLVALFAAHCECRPLDLGIEEGGHAAIHDCDLGILSDIQCALYSSDAEESGGARFRCAAYWNNDEMRAAARTAKP